MDLESSSPPSVFCMRAFLKRRVFLLANRYPLLRNTRCADVSGRLFPEFCRRKAAAIATSQGEEIRTKGGFARTKCVRRRDLIQPDEARRGGGRAQAALSPRRSWRGLPE